MFHIRCAPPSASTTTCWRRRGQPLGTVISELARQALVAPYPETAAGREPASRNSLPLLPLQPGGAPVDLNLVNHLRDELP